MPRLARPLLALLAGTLLLAADVAFADWSHDPDLATPLAASAQDDGGAQALADGQGGFFLTWTHGTAGDYNIYVQHFDAKLTPLWTAGGVQLTTVAGNQALSQLVSDGAGGLIVVWNDFRDLVDFDVYAQRVKSDGAPQWAANGVAVAVGPGNQISNTPAVSDGAGGVILCWSDDHGANVDLYAQRLGPSGAPVWAPGGVVVCNAAGDQSNPRVVSDGQGSAIVAWDDSRDAGTSNTDIYAQRLKVNVGSPVWATNGVAVCTEAGLQSNVAVAADGSGGVFLAWPDYRLGPNSVLFAQRLNSAGTPMWLAGGRQVTTAPSQLGVRVAADGVGGCLLAWDNYGANVDVFGQRLNAAGAPLWAANGVPICTQVAIQYNLALLADGSGGMFVTFEDHRYEDPLSEQSDLFAQHVSAAGATTWATDGVPLVTAAGSQYNVSAVDDGAGGMIATFSDLRNGPQIDVYGMRVTAFGALGNPEPVVASVLDVRGDQGGLVRASWNRSYLDAGPGSRVDEYRVWREVPASLASKVPGASIRTTMAAGVAHYWELVATQPAAGFASYSRVVPTTADSGASNPPLYVMVEARNAASGDHCDSAPASGFSVDNLAPAAPAPFSGAYTPGSGTALSWGANHEADLAGYRLYRGASAAFVPGPSNLVTATALTSFHDAVTGVYKLAAVDVHGNESPYATAIPGGTVGVEGGDLPREVAVSLASPNPSRGGTALRLALPVAARVRAAVFDQQGRRVRELADGPLEAGVSTLRWDGTGPGGTRVASGLYFWRAEVGERRFEGRLAILR